METEEEDKKGDLIMKIIIRATIGLLILAAATYAFAEKRPVNVKNITRDQLIKVLDTAPSAQIAEKDGETYLVFDQEKMLEEIKSTEQIIEKFQRRQAYYADAETTATLKLNRQRALFLRVFPTPTPHPSERGANNGR